ncbi:MAG TPA: class I SAM-dependent methyltransferase [Thermomicrobiales bacterium]|nr:class I SAM-dependent methyltransferase [Thermomicrobiales bacterium]
MQATATRQKGYKGLPMEGFIARWYSRIRGTGSQRAAWREQAARLTAGLPDGADVLEVAPGPGYFAIELARLGRFRVTALDISHTFVELVAEHARQAGVEVDVRQGDASRMPFADGAFDLIVCQAAFKNFSRPGAAIDEMHRVLRDGGTAVIQDMWKDAPDAAIRDEVRGMRLGPVNAFMTRQSLVSLRRRAYTREQFARLAAESAFRGGDIRAEGLGLDVRLTKRGAA